MKPSRRPYWTHWPNVRYELHKRVERACLALARRMPGEMRMWVVVDAANTARRMYPDPTGYAGPDGLAFEHIYDGATRVRMPDRDARPSYPYQDGDTLVLGPQVFVAKSGSVLSWRGENYVPQTLARVE
jgi:hypothetical protein